MSETLIELRNVVKKYDDVAVVNNLSLEIKKGEIFGFLGPSGAGKSKVLTEIFSPFPEFFHACCGRKIML